MKRVHGNLYVHRTNLDELPTTDKELVDQATKLLPKSYKWNMLKVARDKRVSFMYYPNFYENPHPSLYQFANVDTVSGKVKFGSKSKNPVILHRKETFIAKSDSDYDRFEALTNQEVEAGLYQKELLSHIGRVNFWDNLLVEKGLEIKDHVLQKI